MALTTNDGLTAALANARGFAWFKANVTAEAVGRFHSYWFVPGNPGAAIADSPGLAGVAITNAFGSGIIPFTSPGGANTVYLGAFSAVGATAGQVILYDRLWHNSGIVGNTTGAQTVNSVAWPARDENGSTLGANVGLWLECQTATTNAGVVANTTVGYTNSAGVAGRVGNLVPDWPATGVAGTMVPFSLQAGDVGVRSVQSITLGTSYGAGGVVRLVAARQLCTLPIPIPNVGQSLNFYDAGRVLHPGSALALMQLVTATAQGLIMGDFLQIEG